MRQPYSGRMSFFRFVPSPSRHATNINFFHLSVSLSQLWNLTLAVLCLSLVYFWTRDRSHCNFLSFRWILLHYTLAGAPASRYGGLCLWLFVWLLVLDIILPLKTVPSQCPKIAVAWKFIWKYNFMSVKEPWIIFLLFMIVNLCTGLKLLR